MILDKLKHQAAIKSLKKALDANEKNASGYIKTTKIQTIGFVVNFDEFNHTEVFKELAEQIGLRPNSFKIIGYSEKGITGSGYTIPVFSDKDLGWGGNFKNGDIDEFLSRDYDLLVNYYQKSTPILKLVSVRAKAGVKVGLLDDNQAINQITFKIAPSSFTKFRDELIKYLKILKKI